MRELGYEASARKDGEPDDRSAQLRLSRTGAERSDRVRARPGADREPGRCASRAPRLHGARGQCVRVLFEGESN